MLSQEELALHMDVTVDTIKRWRRAGLLRHHRYGGRGECLYEVPDADSPVKHRPQSRTADPMSA